MAGCGDVHALGVGGENDEDDAGDGDDLPRNYPISASFCSESEKSNKQENLQGIIITCVYYRPPHLPHQTLFICFPKMLPWPTTQRVHGSLK